jgi:hypothetical protein
VCNVERLGDVTKSHVDGPKWTLLGACRPPALTGFSPKWSLPCQPARSPVDCGDWLRRNLSDASAHEVSRAISP